MGWGWERGESEELVILSLIGELNSRVKEEENTNFLRKAGRKKKKLAKSVAIGCVPTSILPDRC